MDFLGLLRGDLYLFSYRAPLLYHVFTCFLCLNSERFGIRSSCNSNRGNTQFVGVEWVQPCEFLLDTIHFESEDIGSFYLDSLEGKVSDVAIGFIPLRDSPFDKK